MAKKVYKNLLEREREEKKAQRRPVVQGKKKIKTDRMENMYKELASTDITKRKEEITKRKEEIAARISDMEKEVKGRMTNGKKLSEDIGKKLSKEYDDLKAERSKLEKEENKLENFEKVKPQIDRIRGLRDKEIKKKQENYRLAKQELLAKKANTVKKDLNEKEIERLEKENEKILKKKDISDEDYKKLFINTNRQNSLQKENESLDILTSEIEEEVKLYETGKSKEDAVINKCNMAWRMLLAGKSWDEISLIAAEEMQEKHKKEEIKPAVEETFEELELNEEAELEENGPVNEKETIDDYEYEEFGGKVSNEEIEKELEEYMEENDEHEEEINQENETIEEPENEETHKNTPEPEEKPKWYQFIKRFKIWNEKRKMAKLPDSEKEPETEIDLTSKNENPEKTQRDSFMEYLRGYATREDGDKKKFGGLEVEKQAYERIEKADKEK